ncbi:site-specific DNA-methyltransferase [archaeon]|nr:site-specific DNA-methyltransferase [archaeon]
MPDKCVNLVLTDPPYGIGADKGIGGNNRGIRKKYNDSWDILPRKEIFDEIFRVSKNQIIFGGNYMVEYLYNSSCWIVWDKNNSGNFADCELAWTSFKGAVRKVKWTWNGMIQENMKNKEQRFHPTQKPVPVMKWILGKYSEENEIIFDPFLGSGTTAVAAKQLGRDFIGVEISEKYCEIARNRLKQGVLL